MKRWYDMKKRNLLIIAILGVTLLVTIFVLAGTPLVIELSNINQGSRSLADGGNYSGTLLNISFLMNSPDNQSLLNVTFFWQIYSNNSLLFTFSPANGSNMSRVVVSNETGQGAAYGRNRTFWNYSLDTTTLPNGQYNITINVNNVTFGNLTNHSFMRSIVIDNIPPTNVTVTNPAAGTTANIASPGNDAEANITFNVTTIEANLTGVSSVVFQFSNGTSRPFNRTATINNTATAPTILTKPTFWGVSVNKSSFADENPMTVTVYSIDFAGSTNSTATFSLNVDKTLPTISLTKSESTDDSLTITLTTSSDAGTCTSDLGTVTGTAATRTITATGLAADTSYSFTVRCSDEVGNSGSGTSSFTTDAQSGGSGAGTGTGTGGAPSRRAAREAAAPTTTAPEVEVVVMNFNVNEATPITVGETSHTVTVLSATAESVTVTLSSEPVTLTLNAGETRKIDTDGDGKNDLSVKYVSLVAGKPKLEFRTLAVEVTPVEPVAPVGGAQPEAGAGEEAATGGNAGLVWVVVLIVVVVLAAGAYFGLRKRN